MQRGWLIFLVVILSGQRPASAAVTSGISVEITPARIFRHTFDPRHPPGEMPKLTPLEAGVCRFEFSCEMESHVAAEQLSTDAITARFTTTRIITHLSIQVWTPVNGPQKITSHEEAHREICERYYRLADAVASRLGGQALAAPVNLTSSDPTALKKAVRKMQGPLIAQFMRETAQRCSFAQDRFDAITDHSLNPIDEPVAIAQAMAEEAKHVRSEPKP